MGASMFRTLNIEDLKQAARFVIPNTSDSIAYEEFLKFFNERKEITKHELIIGINFAYGWMPTIFEFYPKKTKKEAIVRIEEVVIILNKAKEGNLLNETELQSLKECFNNSLVGASKLLHFINPKKYAIWDSRVYYYLTRNQAHDYRINNYNTYLKYLEYCNEIIAQKDFDKFKEVLETQLNLGYSISSLRALDLIFYHNGILEKQKSLSVSE